MSNKSLGGTKMKKNYNLENSIERGDFIKDSFRIFGNEQVLMSCSDGLTYVFDNICEAISFVIHRVKEIDCIGYFKDSWFFNINTRDMGVFIETEIETYTIKTLESYRYVSERKRIEEENKELKFFLGDSKQKFAESINSKVKLIKAELESINFSDETKVTKILNRYFGNGWKSYWYTTNQLTQSSVEVILNVVLSDNTNLRLPISIERVTALKLPSIIKRKENNE